MNPEKEGKTTKVSVSPEVLADYFLTVSHPTRIQILSLLTEDRMDFASLLAKTGIKKTALSNQLAKLIEKRLIRKVGHGLYALTKDGKHILKVISDTYTRSRLSLEDEKRRIRERYTYRSDEKMTADIQVEIVKLEPMVVASVQAISKSPEEEAWKKMVAFAEPRGLLKDLKKNPVFGFNNPNPTKGKDEYGYEFWIRIDPDIELEEGVTKKKFGGGLYAVKRCNLTQEAASPFLQEHGALESWVQLGDWFKTSGYKMGKHQCLEKSVNPNKPDEDLLLDIMWPIEK